MKCSFKKSFVMHAGPEFQTCDSKSQRPLTRPLIAALLGLL
jgi:hypothetical protein